tara:strand:+ start:1312 stop:2382 length:1071 start_codon:yes stop_codon:yes gene_type:complete
MLNEFSKKEAPIQGVAGLGGGVPSRLLTLASGTTTYVDDVFSTFLYDGTGSAQTITNGIDLSGEGGLVWIKSRNNSYDHRLTDTERGLGKALESNTTDAEATTAHCVNGSFNSDGFSLSNTGTPSAVNTSGDSICSWTFRKCPKFFDVITYTGTGSATTVAHNLGSVPGMIIVKRTNATSSWYVYHRSLGATKELRLNSNNSANTSSIYWNDTEPTSSVFSVGTSAGVNASGDSYVAYLFAHNEQEFGTGGDEAIIHCGSYSGASTGPTITTGFEVKWIMIKRTDTAANWRLYDAVRGFTTGGDPFLKPNTNDAEVTTGDDRVRPTSTGFQVCNSSVGDAAINNGSGSSYIYIAIA